MRRRRPRQEQAERQEQGRAESRHRRRLSAMPGCARAAAARPRRRRSPRAALPAMPAMPIGQARRAMRSPATPRSSSRCDEARALGLRADQAEEAEVAAAQDRLDDAQVEVVLVGEDEVEGARRRRAAPRPRSVSTRSGGCAPARASRARSSPGTPSSRSSIQSTAHVERRERAGDGAADVAGAVQLQVEERRRAPASAPSAAASSGAKASVTAPPQHWPSDGPSAKCRCCGRAGRRAASSARARGDRLQLEVAAADRADSSRRAPPACACRARAAPSRGVRTTSTTTAARPVAAASARGDVAAPPGRSRQACAPAPRSTARRIASRRRRRRAAADRCGGRRRPRPRRGSRRRPRTAAAAAARRRPCCGGCVSATLPACEEARRRTPAGSRWRSGSCRCSAHASSAGRPWRAVVRMPDQLLHRQPAHALDEGALDLADVDRRVERARRRRAARRRAAASTRRSACRRRPR